MATCARCRLDFEQLRTSASLRTLAAVKELSERGIQREIHLYCPACGERNAVDLKPYGLFFRNGKLFRWRGADAKIETSHGVCRISLGQLALEFPENMKSDFLADDDFSREHICYPAVPVFRQLDGSLQPPTLPVRREYMDLVEQSHQPQTQITGNGEYRFTFHLLVSEQPVEIVLRGIPVQPGQTYSVNEAAVFEGAHLALWPKTNYRDWRRYFVRFGCGEGENDLIVPDREVKVWAFAAKSLDAAPTAREWLPLDTILPDERTRFACVESRPGWVAIELGDKRRSRESGGGIWQIAPATAAYNDLETSFAVDFGTSNTCIAWKATGAAQLFSITNCAEFIIRGSELPERLASPDTWPPRQGFGRQRALLPTEILTREKVGEYRQKGKKVADWLPVVDYSIPTAGVEFEFSETDYVIADFKWRNMISDLWFRQQGGDLQRKYIEFLLLCALAELGRQNAIGSSVSVKFSYPLAFDSDEQQGLVAAIKEACGDIKRQTGVTVALELRQENGKELLSVDEARAAAQGIDAPTMRYAACLYVDIGGGSTDIALLELSKGRRGNESRYAYICSFQYAGGGLAAALAGAGCLKANYDLSHFRRRIREAGSLNELMNSNRLFSSNKQLVITNKSALFYAFLGQFLARLLAAHQINRHRLAEPGGNGGAPDNDSAPAERETEHVLLYPLGNGWGFGSFVNDRFAERVFSKELTKQANAILDEAIQRKLVVPNIPRLEVTGQLVENPKNAVAFGLLTDTGHEDVKKDVWTWQSIVGWTVRTSGNKVAEWFWPVTGGDPTAPAGAPSIESGSSLECLPDEWPQFPANLPSPHELDEELQSIYRELIARCSPTATGQDWFKDSPFHVLLEKLFKPKLKELV